MNVIPAIDLIGGKTVRLEEGRYDRRLNYDIDPVAAAVKWASAGARMLHVVDLDGAKLGKPVNLDVVAKIAASVKIPVEVGGGFRDKAGIKAALRAGAKRAILGSVAVENTDFSRECFDEFGDGVIFSFDARDLVPRARGWLESSELDLFDVLRKFVSFGVKEIIYTDIKKDGTLSGPAVDNVEKILDTVRVKVISAGGVKTLDHILQLKKLEKKGLTGVIVGRAIYEGTLDLKEAISAGEADNTVS